RRLCASELAFLGRLIRATAAALTTATVFASCGQERSFEGAVSSIMAPRVSFAALTGRDSAAAAHASRAYKASPLRVLLGRGPSPHLIRAQLRSPAVHRPQRVTKGRSPLGQRSGRRTDSRSGRVAVTRDDRRAARRWSHDACGSRLQDPRL